MPDNNYKDIEIPIVPVVEEIKGGKDAFNDIQKQLENSIGKKIDIINKKIIDTTKNIQLAFIKIGKDKYVKALLNIDKVTGNLKKFEVSTDKNGELKTYTGSQAKRLSNSVNIKSLENTELLIQKELKERAKNNEFKNIYNASNIMGSTRNVIGISGIDSANLEQLDKYIKSLESKVKQLGSKYETLGSTGSKNVNLITDAMAELNKEIDSAKSKQEELQIAQTQESTNRRLEAIQNLANLMGQTLTPLEKMKIELNASEKELTELKNQYMRLSEEGVTDLTELENKIREVSVRVSELRGQVKKESKKGFFQSLFDTIKRVAKYRISKASLVAIEKAISGGINNLANFDSAFGNTMSTIQSQFTIISNSLGLMFSSLYTAFAPIITVIAQVIATLANVISYLTAKISNQNKYLKVNTEYWEDIINQSQMLSFDSFESLGQTVSYEDMFIEADVSDGLSGALDLDSLNESFSELLDNLSLIQEVLIAIGVTTAFVWVTSKVGKFVSGLKTITKNLTGVEGSAGSVGIQLASIAAIITGIVLMIESITSILDWDETTSGAQKVLNVLTLILATVAVIAGAIAFIKSGTVVGGIMAIAAVTAALLAIDTSVIASTYANGGVVDSGSLFVAGEAGAELVTTMPSGKTGVTNIEQFSVAFVDGLNEWWSSAKYDLPEASTFNLDGAQIARSKRFISEINRKNTGLNLR